METPLSCHQPIELHLYNLLFLSYYEEDKDPPIKGKFFHLWIEYPSLSIFFTCYFLIPLLHLQPFLPNSIIPISIQRCFSISHLYKKPKSPNTTLPADTTLCVFFQSQASKGLPGQSAYTPSPPISLFTSCQHGNQVKFSSETS